MKTLVFALLASSMVITPAAAQQVVNLPSLNSMIEQSTGINPGETSVPSSKQSMPRAKQRKGSQIDSSQPPSDPIGDQINQAQQQAKKAQENSSSALGAQQQAMIKEIQKLIKHQQKKYKPLKTVRYLPPNSTSY